MGNQNERLLKPNAETQNVDMFGQHYPSGQV